MTKMKGAIAGATILSLAVIVLVSGAAIASAVKVADMAWDESNVAVLRSASIFDIEDFVNRDPCDDDGIGCPKIVVHQFVWADLQGKGRYALVDLRDYGDQSKSLGIDIYQRNSLGEISDQSIAGVVDEDLTHAIRDLNGDGKKELIVYSVLEGRTRMDPLGELPSVYRLQGGHYVEASRDFPNFFDQEVLPPMERDIAALQKRTDSEVEARSSGEALLKQSNLIDAGEVDNRWSPEQAAALHDVARLARLKLLRYKILRGIGRDPSVDEEAQAQEWIKSPDIEVVYDAQVAIKDIGGHEAELREAREAMLRIRKRPSDNRQKEERTIQPLPAQPPVAPVSPVGTVP